MGAVSDNERCAQRWFANTYDREVRQMEVRCSMHREHVGRCRAKDQELLELLRTAKALLFYVETYGGEVTANIRAAIPMYRKAIEDADRQ